MCHIARWQYSDTHIIILPLT
ncbi:hypothetical protein ID866_11500 [Astraeus odoratus]|nr:hypothetical protein ID866_11500 [Astraeus odoratus]